MNAAQFPPKRILVPFDFSEHSKHALAYAGTLAEVHGAEVWLLHVGPSTPAISGPLPDVTAAQAKVWTELLAEREAALVKELSKVAGDWTKRVTLHQAWRSGEPSNAIMEFADEKDIELVVMGSHGRTGVKRALLGSVAERTVRLCQRPVLVVR